MVMAKRRVMSGVITHILSYADQGLACCCDEQEGVVMLPKAAESRADVS